MISGKIKAHFGVEVLVQTGFGEFFRVKVARNSGHVVGDNVQIIDERLMRLTRQNELRRTTRFGIQTLAANLSYVGIVLSSSPKTPDFFVEQVIIACRAAQISPFIVITKPDLPDAFEFSHMIQKRFSSSVPVLDTFESLEAFLTPGKRFIFVGVSGAGKSTLINRLIPDAKQRVGALSAHKAQGQHTTSGAMLLDLPCGAELIDSPGVRDFRPVEVSQDDIAHYFPGFESINPQDCKFTNCQHESEPGCQIRELASPELYQQYLQYKLSI